MTDLERIEAKIDKLLSLLGEGRDRTTGSAPLFFYWHFASRSAMAAGLKR